MRDKYYDNRNLKNYGMYASPTLDPISIQADILNRTLTGDLSIQNPAATNSSVGPIDSLAEAHLQTEVNGILYNIPTVFNINKSSSYAWHILTLKALCIPPN
jgi:hypothetical protein